MKAKTLLHLGAGALMSHSIRKIRELGVRVVATDGNPKAPALSTADAATVLNIRDAQEVEACARQYSAAAILAVNEAGVLSAAVASAALGLINLPPSVAYRALHKGAMRQAWQEAGLQQPRFRVVANDGELNSAASEIGYPLIVKPAMNWGSRGVSLVSRSADLPWAIEFARSNTKTGEIIVEQFIDGTEMTIEGLVLDGTVEILAASDKEAQPHPRYRVAMGLNYPPYFPAQQIEAAYDLVRRAIRALGIENGAFHCECMVNESGVYLVELGARPGGGHIFGQIVEAVSGVCMPQALARILLGEKPEIRARSQRGACYRFFNAPPGIFRAAHGVAEAAAMPGILDLGFTMAPGTRSGPISGDADRPGYVVSSGSTREEAMENATRAVASIRFVMDEEAACAQ